MAEGHKAQSSDSLASHSSDKGGSTTTLFRREDPAAQSGKIKARLVLSTFATIVLAFGLMAFVSVMDLNNIVDSFLQISKERSEEIVQQLKGNSDAHINKIQKLYERFMEDKGLTLLDRHRLVVEPMYVDNSFIDLRTFLKSIYSLDQDIILASFFTVEGDTVKAWQYLSESHPNGIGLNNRFDVNSGNWVVVGGDGKTQTISDPWVGKIIKRSKKSMRRGLYPVIRDGKRVQISIYDCIIPIKNEDDEESAGYLRYLISLEKMQSAIAFEKNALKEALRAQEEKAALTTQKTKRLQDESLDRSIMFLSISALAILILAYFPTDLFVSRLTGQLVAINQQLQVAKDNAEAANKEKEEFLRVSNLIGDVRSKLISTVALEQKLEWVSLSIEQCFHLNYAGFWLYDEGNSQWNMVAESGLNAHELSAMVPDLVDFGGLARRKLAKDIKNNIGMSMVEESSAVLQAVGVNAMAYYKLTSDQGKTFGALVILKQIPITGYEDSELEGLVNTASQVLEISEAQGQLRIAQEKMMDAAHEAGMAEIATGVLHNVGNILNSVNVAAEAISEDLKHSKLSFLDQANAMVTEHKSNIGEFLTQDPKGKKLPEMYAYLGKAMSEEQVQLKHNMEKISKGVELIKEVIATQQMYAKGNLFLEEVDVEAIIEDAISMQLDDRHGIEVARDYDDLPKILVQKSKLAHILVNLIKNAKEAMEGVALNGSTHRVTIKTESLSNEYRICVSDTGCGISAENLEKIFTHSFTTKVDGHGFGLHACANSMTEMGGSISVDSEGVNLGSTFTLHFPKERELSHGPAV